MVKSFKRCLFILLAIGLSAGLVSCDGAVKTNSSVSANLTSAQTSTSNPLTSTEKTVAEYSVEFNYNYDGSPNATTIKIQEGQKISKPEDPTRAGYQFIGWTTDASGESIYSFGSNVTSSFTLYAQWLEEGATFYTVVLHYNDGVTENSVIKVKENSRAPQPSTPERSNYIFSYWCSDETLQTKFIFSTKITSNLNLYARWMALKVFEAENTDISDILGQGFSGTATGSDMILSAKDASGGKFVTYLYKKGITLEFGIVSDKEVQDANLYLRLSAEVKDITITCENYLVEVNDEPISYNDIVLNNVPVSTSGTIKPFEDYLISMSVHLVSGANTIKLITNNSDAMDGTMYATAPMVDCLKIASTSEVVWNSSLGYPFDLS